MKKNASPSNAEPYSETRFHGLAALKTVQKTLQQRAQQAAREKAEQRKQENQRHADANLFRRSMGSVTPLEPSGRVTHFATKPAPHPRQRIQDELRVLDESLSDEFDVETLLDTDESLSYRRPDIGPDVVRKLRRGHWALQGQLDLHGLRSTEAREALGAFLREATKQGLRCVRVVHGKGLGSPGKTPVLKNKVLSWLVQKNDVLAYTQARAAEGGAGALIVLLRTSQQL